MHADEKLLFKRKFVSLLSQMLLMMFTILIISFMRQYANMGLDCLDNSNVKCWEEAMEHIGRLARMSVLDTEVDGSDPDSSMLFP